MCSRKLALLLKKIQIIQKKITLILRKYQLTVKTNINNNFESFVHMVKFFFF